MNWQFSSLEVLLETKLQVSFHNQQNKEDKKHRQKKIPNNDNVKEMILYH